MSERPSPRTVLHLVDSEELGGAEQQLATLIRHLDRERFRSVLVHTGAPGLLPLVEALRALGITDRRMPVMPDGLRGGVTAAGFARELRRLRPDVAHVHLTWPLAQKWALVAALAARVPAVVATVHSAVPFLTDRWILWQQGRIARRTGRYLAVSEGVRAACLERVGWPAERVTVVHNGIELERFQDGDRVAGRARLGLAAHDRLVLTCSRLDRLKGLDVLVDAAAALPGVQVAIAGNGPLRADLAAQIAREGLQDRVRLLGARSDVPDLLAASDIVVLPSRFEGLPVSLIEAMAAARPLVATDIPGVDELIDQGENGLLVPVDDAPALAGAIGTLLDDPGLSARIGETGRRRAEAAHTAEAMAQAVMRVYAEELARRGRRS